MSSTFSPAASLIGGVLIGLSAALLLLAHGRIAGITGVLGEALRGRRDDLEWRILFLCGLVGGGVVLARMRPNAFDGQLDVAAPVLLVAGLLVGFGTRMANGCTSGHGVCGVGRLSKRSIVATMVFMATGALTVFVVRHVGGGGTP